MTDRPYDPAKGPDANFKPPTLEIAGTVEGWRSWGVSQELPHYGTAPKLYSVSIRSYYWVPRRESIAECEKCGINVPGEAHTCGFYSAKTMEHLMSMHYHQYDADYSGMFHVVGQVANWGKVVEGTQGWRAQKSYPTKLYIPYEAHKLAIPLKKAYGVSVQLMNFLKGDEK